MSLLRLVAVPLTILLLAAGILIFLYRPAPGPAGSSVPAAYAGAHVPTELQDRQAIHRVYLDNCAPCHGADGSGNGPAARGLDPAPAPFQRPGFLDGRTDAYLFWRISEGKPGSAMPRFRGTLSRQTRLALVRYLRERWQDR